MTKYTKNRYRPLTIVIAILFCLFLLPNLAHAQIDWLVGNTVLAFLAGTLNFIRGALVSLIGTIASGIDSILKFAVADSPVVQESWEIVRNFANMLFIIALIVMAFGTIFNIKGYDKSLIPRFLIAALLINFSLVIGNVIIGWTQSLSNVFLSAIGDVGARIAAGISIADLFKQSVIQTYTVDNRLWTETITIFFNILLLSVVLFSLLVLFVLSIIRIPILWALLIVSPVAWITYILPSTNHISKRWWKEFIGWNIFLPIYLFFIYFGTFFLANQQRVIAGMTNQPLSGGLGTTFQQLFFFVLVAIFLIGGAKVAMGMSSAAGAGTIATATWARGRAAARFAGLAPYRGGKYLAGVGWRASGAEGVYKEAQDKFKREGFAGFEATEKTILGKLYKGQRGREEAAVWLGGKVKDVTGIDLAPGLKEKQFVKNIDYETQKLRDKKISDNRPELERIISSADTSKEEKVAAGKLLKEFHVDELDMGQIQQVYEAYNSEGLTAQASKFLSGLNYKKLSGDALRQLRGMAVNPAYQAQFMERVNDAIVDKGNFKDMNEYVTLLSSYSGPNKNDSILDALKRSEDFRKNLGKADNQDLFTQFAGNIEAQRVLAESMLKKGFFDRAGLENITGNIDPSGVVTGGIYENDFQREQALNSAKDTEFEAAIELQGRFGLLRDVNGDYYDRNPQVQRQNRAAMDARIEEAMNRQAERKSVTQILKMSNDTLRSGRFQRIIEPRLDIGAIESMPNNPEYTSAKGAALENLMEMVRQRSLVADKINPLAENMNRIRNLIPSIVSATNESALSVIEQQAKGITSRIRSLIKEINDNKFAEQRRKDEANNNSSQILADLDQAIKAAKERLKPPKPPKGGGEAGGSSPKIELTPGARFEIENPKS